MDDDQADRLLGGYGLVETDLDTCARSLDGAKRGRTSVLSVVDQHASRAAALAHLRHLTAPATRLALFAVGERWTGVVTNDRDGSDFHDHQWWFSRLCAARSIRVVSRDAAWDRVGPYRERARYAATMFVLSDPEGETIRSLSAADDGGRWDHDTYGEPLPGEPAFDVTARRKRDRFTPVDLEAMLRLLRVDPPAPDAFAAAERFVLVNEHIQDASWAELVEARACTPEQAADPGFGYLGRALERLRQLGGTYDESVVLDLQKALLLSPALASEARPHLHRASDAGIDAAAAAVAADEQLRRRRRS